MHASNENDTYLLVTEINSQRLLSLFTQIPILIRLLPLPFYLG